MLSGANLCWITLLIPLAGCNINSETILSSRKSPDGAKVAANIIVESYEPTGRISIRNAYGYTYQMNFREPSASSFLIWSSDSRLEIWSEYNESVGQGDDTLGGVQIVYKQYEFPHNDSNTYGRSDLNIYTVKVENQDIIASFSSVEKENYKQCLLKIETVHNKEFSAASIEIDENITSKSGSVPPRAGISTLFSLQNNKNTNYQATLTSATVSDIPSYNRLPTGSEGNSVRGQFFDKGSVALIERLDDQYITLNFSQNFFERVINYQIPLQNVREKIVDFKKCGGNADLLRVEHRR